MKISVIIPTYNRAHLIQRAIDSVLNQTYPVNQLIVVNDGSTDKTQETLSKYKPNVKTITINNNGVSYARNVGIKEAHGDWIAFLDSDDEWKQTKLAKQVIAIQSTPNTVFCHTEEIWVRNGKRINPMKKHKKYGGYVFQKNLDRCLISPSSVLMKKSLIYDVGFFDTAFPICEDYDLWLKILAKYPVLFIDEPLVIKYGGHDDQLSKHTEKIEMYRIKALTNILDDKSLNSKNELAVLETLIYKCKIYLLGAIKRDYNFEINLMEEKIHSYQKRHLEIKKTLT